jgi:histone acetyltransferase
VTGLGFATRDQGAKIQEDQGILDYKILKNDGNRENMKLLIDLKNIFSRQLPKMPKEYIVKLVFDRHHESMVILKNS